MRTRTLAGMAVVGVALGCVPAGALAPSFTGRAFVVDAEAFPVDPSPGRGTIVISARPDSSRATATNPPSAAHSRAAATDFGTAESYTGEQGPSASADTATKGSPPSSSEESGGTVLHAHADPTPLATADAAGGPGTTATFSYQQASSTARADGSGTTLAAEAHSAVSGAVYGPLRVGSARFDALASTTGRPGGARAVGTVTVQDATVGGVPVIIDGAGVRVDQTRVPAAQVAALNRSVRDSLAQGGYSDVRVVQPNTSTSPDGSRAVVSGGGMRLFFTANDPQNPYFLSATLAGGAAQVILGDQVGDAGAPGSQAGGPSTTAPAPAPSGGLDPFIPQPAGVAPPTTNSVQRQVALGHLEGAGSVRLVGAWGGWVWLVVFGVLLALAAWALQRPALAVPHDRLVAFGRSLADRYLRG